MQGAKSRDKRRGWAQKADGDIFTQQVVSIDVSAPERGVSVMQEQHIRPFPPNRQRDKSSDGSFFVLDKLLSFALEQLTDVCGRIARVFSGRHAA